MSEVTRLFGLAAIGAAVFMMPGSAAYAAGKTEVSIAIKDHRFQPAEIKVPAGKPIVLKIDNQDAAAEEFECHKLNVEKVVPGNSTGIVRLRALKAGNYSCVGEFHEDTAKATIIAE